MTAPRLSIVTTCKGRLEHLKQSLPRMAGQPDCECIVVDYDCPDGTADWVRREFPAVRIVKVDQAPVYHAARARNLGARAALTEWLVFVDADVLVAPDFTAVLRPDLRRGQFLRAVPGTRETCGTFACHRSDFLAIDGYDEVLEGYGGEDHDIFLRLVQSGRAEAGFDGTLIESITHGDEMRTGNQVLQDLELNRRINSFYNNIKYDLAHESGQTNLPLAMRSALYREVRNTLLKPANIATASATITVTLPTRLFLPLTDGWTIKRRWIFELGKVQGNEAIAQ